MTDQANDHAVEVAIEEIANNFLGSFHSPDIAHNGAVRANLMDTIRRYIMPIIRSEYEGRGEQRLAPFTKYLACYADKAKEWGVDKTEYEWLAKLQDEVDEARGVLDGTHNDSLHHELLQIATIAFHWMEWFHPHPTPNIKPDQGGGLNLDEGLDAGATESTAGKSMLALYGSDPDFTGGLTPEEYIRRQRCGDSANKNEGAQLRYVPDEGFIVDTSKPFDGVGEYYRLASGDHKIVCCSVVPEDAEWIIAKHPKNERAQGDDGRDWTLVEVGICNESPACQFEIPRWLYLQIRRNGVDDYLSASPALPDCPWVGPFDVATDIHGNYWVTAGGDYILQLTNGDEDSQYDNIPDKATWLCAVLNERKK